MSEKGASFLFFIEDVKVDGPWIFLHFYQEDAHWKLLMPYARWSLCFLWDGVGWGRGCFGINKLLFTLFSIACFVQIGGQLSLCMLQCWDRSGNPETSVSFWTVQPPGMQGDKCVENSVAKNIFIMIFTFSILFRNAWSQNGPCFFLLCWNGVGHYFSWLGARAPGLLGDAGDKNLFVTTFYTIFLGLSMSALD